MSAAWPPPVSPGDRVGVAALSGAATHDAVERGLAALRDLGYEPVPARNLTASYGPLAGTDSERVSAFHELIADDSLAAIFFARGGYGIHRVLPLIDWDLVARRPRAWVGYSDLTPLLLQVVQRQNLVTFHGPLVATDLARGLDPDEVDSLTGALAGDAPRPQLVRWLRAESAEGPVLGGCLSLLASLAGTPWATSFRDALLFVEDVNEPIYRVDRMLTHLRLSDSLTGVRGILAGHFGGDWEQAVADSTAAWHHETLLAQPGPVAWGLPCGHGLPNLTLPLGAHAMLDPVAGVLEIRPPG